MKSEKDPQPKVGHPDDFGVRPDRPCFPIADTRRHDAPDTRGHDGPQIHRHAHPPVTSIHLKNIYISGRPPLQPPNGG